MSTLRDSEGRRVPLAVRAMVVLITTLALSAASAAAKDPIGPDPDSPSATVTDELSLTSARTSMVAGRGAESTGSPGFDAAPTTPTRICGTAILISPYRYHGAPGTFTRSGIAGLPTFGAPGTDFPAQRKVVVIPAGDNTELGTVGALEDNYTVFYFAPGVHHMRSGMYTGHDSAYVGGYTPELGKAVIDGVDGATGGTGKGGAYLSSSKASSGDRTYNTWQYLTVRNFSSSVNNAVMGNVNGGNSSIGDTYKYNTIGPNQYGWRGDDVAPGRGQSSGGGYAINMSDNTTVQFNCITENAQGGFNGSGHNINISRNEISKNGLGVYPDVAGPGASPYACGCSGGGKLNFATNPTVSHNYVHGNYNAGIWLDFDNTGADISYNFVEANWGVGIEYEASYNANITYNTVIGNGWASQKPWPKGIGGQPCYGDVDCSVGLGPVTGRGGGFPYSAIYVANSGGYPALDTIRLSDGSAVPARYAGLLLVRGNVLRDNFGGVAVYTDTDRFPGGLNNNSACSVPLAGMVPTYYRQTKVLLARGSTISGSTVSTTAGANTLCSFYDSGSQDNGYQEEVPRTPVAGMGVYDVAAGHFVGNVTSASSPHSFVLDRVVEGVTATDLLISAYGGCGPANYYGGGPNKASGSPVAHYWDNCLWGTRNVLVSGNSLHMQADKVAGCTTANLCGYVTAFAFNAGVPPLMHYFHDYPELIARASGGLGNIWRANRYAWSGGGPGGWQFQAGHQGNAVDRRQWQSAPYGQDAGSGFVRYRQVHRRLRGR